MILALHVGFGGGYVGVRAHAAVEPGAHDASADPGDECALIMRTGRLFFQAFGKAISECVAEVIFDHRWPSQAAQSSRIFWMA